MMKAGKVWIGDLCYVLPDRWDEFCEKTISGHNVLDGEFNLKDGTRFATFTTKYGDGCYEDQDGNEYPVDAGLIGCVAVADIRPEGLDGLKHGRVIEFVRDFSTWKADAEIRIGNVLIDTDPMQDEEDSYA